MRRNHGVLLLAFCVLATALFAQVVITSTIVGTVSDPQGAAIPQANVTLTNVDTGVRISRTSISQFAMLNLIVSLRTLLDRWIESQSNSRQLGPVPLPVFSR